MREVVTAAADLLAWRVVAALTQPAAAALLGLPLRTYIEWETGRRPVRQPRLVALAMGAVAADVPPWQTPPDLAVARPRRGRPRSRPT